MKILHHYSHPHLPYSANEIVPLIIRLTNPKSVVDIGCGLAQWLYVFKQKGIEDVLGIDGKHVPKEKLFIPIENFMEYNLEEGENFQPKKKYDLAISLEVAEHISEANADGFINLVTSLSDTILFSAAIPNQTGKNHLNEQNHSYWQKKFLDKGYYMLDIIRKEIWNNPNINWWYRQNIFLLVKKENPIFNVSTIYDSNQLIHPELLNMYVSELKNCQKLLKAKKRFLNIFNK